MKRIAVLALGLLVVAGLVGTVALRAKMGGLAAPDSMSGGTAAADGPVAFQGSPIPATVTADGSLVLDETQEQAKDLAARQAGALSEPAPVGIEPALTSTGGAGPKVIRTADLSLILAEGGFEEAFDDASMVAQRYGGFVVDSSTTGTRARAGSLLIRVPSDRFDEAMSDLRGLGEEIDRQNVTGTDVTDQFVDLEARLRSWQAQERVLLRLMNQANTINETMQVQNELQRVRYEIESIQGQLRVLRDQTSLATIEVAMHERGAPVPKGDAPKPSILVAWDRAIAGFLGVVSAVVVGLGYLLPLGAIAAAGYLVYRRVRRSVVTPAPEPETGTAG